LLAAATVTQTREQATLATAARIRLAARRGRFTAARFATATVTETREQATLATAARIRLAARRGRGAAARITAALAAETREQTTTATTTTMTAQAGDGRALLTAHEGDADDRDEHRDAENDSTIHSKFLQH
jgi:hypothetical protein